MPIKSTQEFEVTLVLTQEPKEPSTKMKSKECDCLFDILSTYPPLIIMRLKPNADKIRVRDLKFKSIPVGL